MPIIIGEALGNDFRNPLGLLTDCHRRIENFLSILQKVAESANAVLDGEQREALSVSLRYFRESAPKHTADEEESLFPRMLGRGQSDIASVLAELNADHRSLDARHEQIEELCRGWLANDCLRTEEATRLSVTLAQVREKYVRHITIEERDVFPLAGRILRPEDLHSIAQEMAQRRGLSVEGDVIRTLAAMSKAEV